MFMFVSLHFHLHTRISRAGTVLAVPSVSASTHCRSRRPALVMVAPVDLDLI